MTKKQKDPFDNIKELNDKELIDLFKDAYIPNKDGIVCLGVRVPTLTNSGMSLTPKVIEDKGIEMIAKGLLVLNIDEDSVKNIAVGDRVILKAHVALNKLLKMPLNGTKLQIWNYHAIFIDAFNVAVKLDNLEVINEKVAFKTEE